MKGHIKYMTCRVSDKWPHPREGRDPQVEKHRHRRKLFEKQPLLLSPWPPKSSHSTFFPWCAAYQLRHLYIFQSLDTGWKKQRVICSKGKRGQDWTGVGGRSLHSELNETATLLVRRVHMFSSDSWTAQQVPCNLKAGAQCAATLSKRNTKQGTRVQTQQGVSWQGTVQGGLDRFITALFPNRSHKSQLCSNGWPTFPVNHGSNNL